MSLPTSDDKQDPSRASALSSASTIGNKPSGVDLKDYSDNEKAASNDDSSTDIEKQKPQQESGKNDEDDEKDPNIVDWDGPDDPQNPMNFNPKRKWAIATIMGLMTFVVTFASSVLSSATMVIAKQYGVGQEVVVLSISLFVLGFAFGPIVWGPLSELYGRKIPLFFGYFAFAVFLIPVAVAQNLYTIFICRFFGGFFASAPLAVVGGALADFFDPVNRGVAMSLFCASTFIGPTFGPILGGFITMSHLGWRWTQWINLIMAGLMGITGFFVIPETFAPVLLQRKAKAMRYETRNWAIHAPADEKKVNLQEIAEKYLLRPFKMLTLEPILVLVTIYMSIIYGIIYGFFEVFPISFQEQRGWNLGVGALPFLGVLVGVVCGCIIISLITKTRFKRVMEQEGLVPEERLVPMIIGGALLPAGLFWFGWTSYPTISPWPEIISTVPIVSERKAERYEHALTSIFRVLA